jgi:DNA primase
MAGRIPQEFIDELTARLDIAEVIDSYVPLRKAGRDFVARCPFHDEKTPSFTVSTEKQFYHCFGCNAHGTVIRFMMEYHRLDFVEAVRELAARAGMELPRFGGEGSDSEIQKIYEALTEAAAYFRCQLREHPAAREAVAYLKGRGLDGETAGEFGLGFAPPGRDNLVRALGPRHGKELLQAAGLVKKKDHTGDYDVFRGRIMFPIRDTRGRVIAFGGRVMGDGTPKYLNSPESPVFHKGRELYGLYEARKARRRLDRLLVVEGYMDVVMLARHGIRYAVATLGTATTSTHLDRLFRLTPELVFCFDGDRAGRQAAWRALENALPLIKEGRQARFMFLPDGEDPDTLVQKELKEQFEKRVVNAITLSEFFYDTLMRQADTSSIDGRARLVELARPYLSKLCPGIFRHMMVGRLAEIAHIEISALSGLLSGGGSAQELLKKARPRRTDRAGGSLVRKAIGLLLRNPGLAAQTQQRDCEGLRLLDHPGIPLLMEMLDLLWAHPHFTTGTLLEHWRDHAAGQYLDKLAQEEALVAPEKLAEEFADAIRRLRRQCLEQQITRLKSKPPDGMSQEDKDLLRHLLQQKATPI